MIQRSARRTPAGGIASSSALLVGALGVVYGDIGTSPLYAMRECFAPGDGLTITAPHVFGVVSLIFWALTSTISVKYVLYVMRADNHHEGGILALMALALAGTGQAKATRRILTLLGMVGAALLYGDGMITPAISVLSAVEGLAVMDPHAADLGVPIASVILLALFSVQRFGTGLIGSVFGPIMTLWFVVLGALGLRGILYHPTILTALLPTHAFTLLSENPGQAFPVLGAVFLVVTGGEALYADMGHFGRSVISRSWFLLVGPTLLLNYLGQGALLLSKPEAVSHPFFSLAPAPLLGPLVVLSTCAAVIASQALITGAFSLTQQAIMLGFLPRMDITHTSERSVGQIYVPVINGLLLASTLGLVLSFRSSSALAAAYGIAVAATMVLTTTIAAFAFRSRFAWTVPRLVLVTSVLLVVDVAFFLACSGRLLEGGWVPLLVAGLLLLLMATWRRGKNALFRRLQDEVIPLEDFFEVMRVERPARVPGVAVFMTGSTEGTPLALIRNLQHNRLVHKSVVLLSIVTAPVPFVAEKDRLQSTPLPEGFTRVVYHCGFMESPQPARSLPQVTGVSVEHTTFYFGRDTVSVGSGSLVRRLALGLFALLFRNEARAPGFFSLPPDRVIEMGGRLDL